MSVTLQHEPGNWLACVDTDKAGAICATLISEGRYVRCVAWPNERSRIHVEEKDFGRLAELVQALLVAEPQEFDPRDPANRRAIDNYLSINKGDFDTSYDWGSLQVVDGEIQLNGITAVSIPIASLKEYMK